MDTTWQYQMNCGIYQVGYVKSFTFTITTCLKCSLENPIYRNKKSTLKPTNSYPNNSQLSFKI